MKSYAGIDLHASNSYLGIIDTNDNRLFGKPMGDWSGSVLKLHPTKPKYRARI